MSDERHPGTPRQKVPRVEVYWTTITYKTVAMYLSLFFVIVLAVLYLLNPNLFDATVRRLSKALGTSSTPVAALTANQARFVNLDGKVQVKKANSVQWVAADFRTTLDKGDLIETGSDGVARLAFADGTTYTAKSNTLVTVEENSVAPDRSRVAVHISSGAVDLATGSWPSADSKAEVSFADAVASLRQNSRAAVRSDPKNNENEITVAAGGAQVKRGEDSIELGKWEKASLPVGGPMTKASVLAPPDLTQPINLQALSVPEPRRAAVHFEWKPVPDAVAFQLRVSNGSTFARLLTDKHVSGTSTEVTGLDAGDYFWNVTAIDARKNASEPSDTNKFTLVAQGKGQEMLLEVEGTQLHGSVAEIIGRTEPGAALIINGQLVANIQTDGRFRHFTDSLSRGSHSIIMTGQNRRGGTATKSVEIVIP